MKYIETIWTWIYSRLGFKHSAFVKDGKVLSYEMKRWFWTWEFKVYSEKEYFKNKIILNVEDIPDFDILQFEWKKYDWVVCFEALEILSNQKHISLPIKKRTNIILRWFILWMLSNIFIFFIIYYYFTYPLDYCLTQI